MRYIKYMPFHSMKNASRNKRELSVVNEIGYKVLVFSDDKRNEDVSLEDEITLINDGVVKLSYSMSRTKRLLLIIKNRLTVFLKTCFLKADVLSCHDLESLKMAYFGTRIRIKRPKLIYDSHEFELGRNIKRSALQVRKVKRWEKFLISKCEFCIVVNDTIADELVSIYNLQQRPIVIRSTPYKWSIDNTECEEERQRILLSF